MSNVTGARYCIQCWKLLEGGERYIHGACQRQRGDKPLFGTPVFGRMGVKNWSCPCCFNPVTPGKDCPVCGLFNTLTMS